MRYKPCNNAELVLFYAHQCFACKYDHLTEDEPKCLILFKMMLSDPLDDDFPDALNIDAFGVPNCSMFIRGNRRQSIYDLTPCFNSAGDQLSAEFDPLSHYECLARLMRDSGLYID